MAAVQRGHHERNFFPGQSVEEAELGRRRKRRIPVIAEDEKSPWGDTADQIALWLQGDKGSSASAVLQADLTPILAIHIMINFTAVQRGIHRLGL